METSRGHMETTGGYKETIGGHKETKGGHQVTTKGHMKTTKGIIVSTKSHQETTRGHMGTIEGHKENTRGLLETTGGHKEACVCQGAGACPPRTPCCSATPAMSPHRPAPTRSLSVTFANIFARTDLVVHTHCVQCSQLSNCLCSF